MFKNLFASMFSKEKIKTTLTSIISILLFCFTAVGLITSDQQAALKEAYQVIVNAIPGGDWTVVITGVANVIGLIYLIIVKDPKKPLPGTPGKK
jgi:flagellar biosynthesis protein FlhB